MCETVLGGECEATNTIGVVVWVQGDAGRADTHKGKRISFVVSKLEEIDLTEFGSRPSWTKPCQSALSKPFCNEKVRSELHGGRTPK